MGQIILESCVGPVAGKTAPRASGSMADKCERLPSGVLEVKKPPLAFIQQDEQGAPRPGQAVC